MDGFVPHRREDVENYYSLGAWSRETLGDVLDSASDSSPDKEALVDDRVRLTYAQLRMRVERLAIAMMRLGISKGDCVLVQLPNWAEFVYAYFAIHKIGGAVVLLVTGHSAVEVSHLATLSNAKAWIVPERYRKIDYLPTIDSVLNSNPELKGRVILARSEGAGRFHSMDKLMHDAELDEADICKIAERRPNPEEVCIILPTGGTTGLPKAAPRTHNDYICNGIWKGRAFEVSGGDRTLIFSPVGHNLAINGGINPTFLAQGRVVLLDSTRPEDFCGIVQKEKITYAPTVPALITRIINFEGLKDYDLSTLRRIGPGGQGSPPELINSVWDKIGCKYLNSFGMVEGPTVQVRMDDHPDIALYTAGRPVCPYDEFKVVDREGRTLAPGKEGELVCKGPCIFTGYLKSPERNWKAFTADGFFRTGDLATIDEKGNIRITDRIKDIIIRGGENIAATDVEGLITHHPDIEDAAVVGMPDKVLGEKAFAYIRLKRGASKLSLEELAAFMQTMGASKLLIPEGIEYIDEIPLTNVGKADKKALREDIKKRQLSGS